MSWFAALLALIEEIVKAVNAGMTADQRAQDRQAGADAAAAATAEDSARVADEQGRNDRRDRDIDAIARRLRDEAAGADRPGAHAGGAVRASDKLDARAKT